MEWYYRIVETVPWEVMIENIVGENTQSKFDLELEKSESH